MQSRIMLKRRHGLDVYAVELELAGALIASATFWSETGARQWLAGQMRKYKQA